jgi:chemotaxis receptor (MCP) glutamine deamidase CheD
MKITNPKIEKQQGEIEKTKAKIAGHTAKLREQEKHLRNLEDLEIVAQFRKERMSDENLKILASDVPRHLPKASLPPSDTEVSSESIEEESQNANTENE